jgi:hypothetical protein
MVAAVEPPDDAGGVCGREARLSSFRNWKENSHQSAIVLHNGFVSRECLKHSDKNVERSKM